MEARRRSVRTFLKEYVPTVRECWTDGLDKPSCDSDMYSTYNPRELEMNLSCKEKLQEIWAAIIFKFSGGYCKRMNSNL